MLTAEREEHRFPCLDAEAGNWPRRFLLERLHNISGARVLELAVHLTGMAAHADRLIHQDSLHKCIIFARAGFVIRYTATVYRIHTVA